MKKYVKDSIRNKKVAAAKQEMLDGLQDKFLELGEMGKPPQTNVAPSRQSNRSSRSYRR